MGKTIKTHVIKLVPAVALLGMAIAAAPAQAQLVADGVIYTLTETSTAPTTDTFSLSITDINGPTDTEQGRYGVQSFAFTTPAGFVSATAPSGFAYMSGGLNAAGCDGNGGFFCFLGPTPASTVLAANSSLLYNFSVTATGISSWAPSFKINWDGTNNNYDLVSKGIPISGVSAPEIDPASAASGLTLLLGGLVVLLGRRSTKPGNAFA
jgi:hypothetical protein